MQSANLASSGACLEALPGLRRRRLCRPATVRVTINPRISNYSYQCHAFLRSVRGTGFALPQCIASRIEHLTRLIGKMRADMKSIHALSLVAIFASLACAAGCGGENAAADGSASDGVTASQDESLSRHAHRHSSTPAPD